MPAIGNFIVNVGDGWKNFRSGIEDVCRISVEAMTKFTVGAERFCARRGESRAEFGLARKTGTRLDCSHGDERDFERDDIVGLKGEIGDDEGTVVGSGDAEFIMAGRDWKNSEDTFAIRGAGNGLAGLQTPQRKNCARNRNGDVRKTGVANDAIERSGVLRLLTGDAKNLPCRFARLLRGWLLRCRLMKIASITRGRCAEAHGAGSEGCAKGGSGMPRDRIAHESRPEMSGMEQGVAH